MEKSLSPNPHSARENCAMRLKHAGLGGLTESPEAVHRSMAVPRKP